MDEDRKNIDDAWAKERGYVLKRDSCPDCKARWDRGDKTARGEIMYCSAAHAYEVSQIRRAEIFQEKKQKLLDAINPEKMAKEEAEQLLGEIEDRYY